jgi:hypothetical protein
MYVAVLQERWTTFARHVRNDNKVESNTAEAWNHMQGESARAGHVVDLIMDILNNERT